MSVRPLRHRRPDMTKTRISFVMATYNGAAYVEEQLASILGSIGNDDEIVVSDDGSTDDTLAKVVAVEDPRIRILPSGPRLGYQRNFERAIGAALGEYIFFSDQDDICLAARVPKSLAALAEVSCVCGDAIVVDQELKTIHDSYFSQRRAHTGPMMLFIRPSVIGATMACRKEFLMQNLPFPNGVPHDMWLSIRAQLQCELAIVHEPFIFYRRHQTALSGTGTTRRRPFSLRAVERFRLGWALLFGPGQRHDR